MITLALLAALEAAPPAPTAPVPEKLIAIADHVKVRAKPTADGELLGYLFKNMVVDVLDHTPEMEVVGEQRDYWYKVGRGTLVGWSFGGFFSPKLPARAIDTYDVPDLNAWWGTRFGWSTEYYENGVIPDDRLKKLDMDDYRGLILMASKQYGEFGGYAWDALLRTLYPFLKKHANDPKWRYFQDKVWDPTFISSMVASYGGAGVVEALPPSLLADKAFMQKLCAPIRSSMPICNRPPPATP